MADVGTGGAKYVIQFSIEGSGKKDLHEIAKQFASIGGQIDKAAGGGGKGKEGGGLFGSVEGFSSSLEGAVTLANQGVQVFGEMAEAGNKLSEAGVSVLEGFSKGFELLIEKGSEFEQMILRIQGTGQSHQAAMDTVKGAIAFTKELPITEMDAVRIAQTMATVHVDALAKIGDSYEKLAAKGKTMKGLDEYMGLDKMKKEGPRAITVIGDILAATGNLGTGYQGQAIHELMQFIETGAHQSTRAFGPMKEDFKKIASGAHDAGKRIKGMMELLEKRGALGLSQAAMSTFGGVMSNFKGMLDQVSMQVMQPGVKGGLMNKIVLGMQDLYGTISDFFDTSTGKGKEFLGTLREIGTVIIDQLVYGMKLAGNAAKGIMDFVRLNPGVSKAIVIFTLLGSVLAVVAGTLLTFSAVIGGAMIALIAFPEMLLAPLGILLLFPPVLAALAAAVTVVAVIWKNWDSSFSGVKNFFEGANALINGVIEALQNWSGTSTKVTRKTGEDLERTGMMPFFKQILGYIQQIRTTYNSMEEAFTSQKGKDAVAKLESAFETLETAVGKVLTAGFKIATAFGILPEINDNVADAQEKGSGWADTLLRVADNVKGMTDKLDGAFGSVDKLIDGFADFYGNVMIVKSAVAMLFDAAVLLAQPFLDVWHALQSIYFMLHADWSNAKIAGDSIGSGYADAWKNFKNNATYNPDEDENVKALHSSASKWREENNQSKIEVQRPNYSSINADYSRLNSSEGVDPSMVSSQEVASFGPPAPIIHQTTTNLVLDGAVAATVVNKYNLSQSRRAGDTGPDPMDGGMSVDPLMSR